MQKLKVLGSFIKGFEREKAPDVINALFIADKALNKKTLFDFENRDNNGVDSSEIRMLLFFNCENLMEQKKLDEFYHLGKKMSYISSNELKWAAQFLKNGKTHLFPEEAEKAIEVIKQLKIKI
jgi:hypothetical protein